MALGTVQGLNGLVTRAGDLAEWSLKESAFTMDIAIETVLTTGFIDAGNATNAQVGISYSGTITGTGEAGAATSAPFPTTTIALGTTPPLGTLTLDYTTNCTFAITAAYTNIGTVRAENGKMDIVQSWVGSGAPTTAWVEA
jgi:hypothetical protein